MSNPSHHQGGAALPWLLHLAGLALGGWALSTAAARLNLALAWLSRLLG